MIIFDRNTKDLEIPAGLGNLEVNIISGGTGSGVASINGQTGNVSLKTINGNNIVGEGNIEIQGGGVTSGEVQTMIESALTDYATTADTQSEISSALTDYSTTADTKNAIESALTDYATTAVTEQLGTEINNKQNTLIPGAGIGISGDTIYCTSTGKPAVFVNEMSQAELAEFYSTILQYSGSTEKVLENYDIYYYQTQGPNSDKDFFRLSDVSFYRNVFNFRGEAIIWDSSYRGIYQPVILIELKSDGTYTANIDNYCKVLAVTANGTNHTLSYDKGTFGNYWGRIAEGNVPVSLRLTQENVNTTKCNISKSQDNAYLYAEWTDNSGVTYEAKWKFVNNQTPEYFREKSSGGGVTSGEVQTMIESALTDYSTTAQTSQAISTATENMVTSTHIGIIWVGTSQQYADISPKDPNTLYFINNN